MGVERDHPGLLTSGELGSGLHGGGFEGHLASKGTYPHVPCMDILVAPKPAVRKAQEVGYTMDQYTWLRPDLRSGSVLIREGRRHGNPGLIWRANQR